MVGTAAAMDIAKSRRSRRFAREWLWFVGTAAFSAIGVPALFPDARSSDIAESLGLGVLFGVFLVYPVVSLLRLTVWAVQVAAGHASQK